MKRFIFFVTVFCTCLAVSAVIELSRIRLVPEKMTGLRVGQDGAWRLARPLQQDAEGRIFALVADHDRCIIAPPEYSWFTDDPKFPNARVLYQGSYSRNLVAFDFELKEEMTVRPWFLVRTTNPAALHFTMEFNRTEGRKEAFGYSLDNHHELVRTTRGKLKDGTSFDEKAYRSMEYFWMPGDKLKLSGGPHTLRLRNGFYYMNLAAVAVLPDGVRPASLTPAFSQRRQVEEGQIDFAPFQGQLTALEQSGHHCQVSVNGQPFRPADALESQVSGTVRVRLTVKELSGALPEIVARIAPVPRIILANADNWLSFDPRSGRLTGWRVADGPELIPPEQPQPLFSLEHGLPPNVPWKSVKQPALADSFTEGPSSVSFTYTPLPGVTAIVKVSLTPGRGKAPSEPPLWELELVNHSANEIRHLGFPQFKSVSLGMDAEALRLTRTHDMTGFNHPGALVGFQGRIAGPHPGFHTMGYLAFHSQEWGSFTLQRRLADGYGVRFAFSPNAQMTGAECSATRRYALEPGKSTTLTYLAGFLRGDEYDCCDLYGQWCHSWMDFSRVNTPFTKFIHSMGRSRGYPIGRAATQQLPLLRWMGVNAVWELGGRLVFTPCFLPRLGTPRQLADEKGILRSGGVQTYAYFDIMGTSDDYATWDSIAGIPKSQLPNPLLLKPGDAHRGGVQMQNGKLAPWGWTKNHASQDNVMCLDDDLWSTYVARAIQDEYLGKYGLSVYTDECNYYVECYNRNHRHGPQYASRMVGTADLYTKLLAVIRPQNPWFSFFGEGAVDFLTQFNEFVIRNGMDCVDGAPLMFALPEVKIMRGCANAFTDGAPDWEDALREYQLFARNFTSPELAQNTRQFNLHRARIMDWMYNARFRDCAGLSFTAPGVRARYFVRDSDGCRGLVVNFHNPFERADVRCRLSLDRLPGWAADCLPEAACYDMEGESLSSLPIAIEDGCLTFAAPRCKAGSVIVMARAPEGELLRGLLTWPQVAGHDHLKLCLVNLDRKERRVRLVMKAAAPLEIEPPPAEVSIAPGQNLVFKLPMKNRQRLQDFTTVEMKIDDKPVSVLVAPELCNRDFEQHASGDLRPDHWGVCDYYYEIAYRQTVECPVSTWLVGGELTEATPVSGKYALKLPGHSEPLPISTKAPPMGGPHYGGTGWPQKEISLPWYYNAGQYAILKPDTSYRFSFSVRFEDGDGVLRVQAYPYTERRDVKSYLFATQEINAQAGSQGWRRHTIEFHTPEQPLNNLKTPIWFVNRARSPLLLDDISLQETGTPDSR